VKSIHITLRSLQKTDKQQFAKLLNNKHILNNLRDHIPYPYTENDALYFFDYVANNDAEKVFAVTYKNELCGVVSLVLQKDVHRHTAEIGYWLGKPFWGKGIATQVVSMMTNYGFDELHLKRVYAIVFENNKASMRVLEKNGYQKEGVLVKAILKNGKLLDEYRFYKLNENWISY